MSIVAFQGSEDATHARVLEGVAKSQSPQKALCGGIPGSFLEPLVRSWSHFVGIYCQKSTRSLDNRLLRYPHKGPRVVVRHWCERYGGRGKGLRERFLRQLI